MARSRKKAAALDVIAETAYDQWFHVDIDDDEMGETLGSRLHSKLENLEDDHRGHLMQQVKHLSMYQNMDMRIAVDFMTSPEPFQKQVVNVIQCVVDNLVAKQVVNQSKATFDVTDGDWEAQTKAENLDKFTFGEFYRMDVYQEHEQALRDALVFGDGWVHYFPRGGKVACERVYPLEMRLDVDTTVSGPPQELYRVRYLPRQNAIAAYPDHAELIQQLPNTDPPYPYPTASGREVSNVRLVEAWHLPVDVAGTRGDSDPLPGDRGVYVLACNDCVLDVREYDRFRFPFLRMPYSKNIAGGYSIGVVQQLCPTQAEFNFLEMRKLKGLALHAIPRVFHQAGGTITPSMSNSGEQVNKFTGSKPEVIQAPCYSQQVSEESKNKENQIWQQGGVSPLERGADMPSRVDSRPGMREYSGVMDEKHALPSLTWNRSFLGAARLIIDVAREIVAEHGSYRAMGKAKQFIDTIEFADIDLDDDRFQIKLQNTNLLPTQPAGKRMTILDFLKTDAFKNDPTVLFEMMAGDHPDIDSFLNRKTAGVKLIEKQMYYMVSKGKYFAPDDHQDAQYAKSIANDTVQQLLLQSNGGLDSNGEEIGEVRKRIDLLDKYILACDSIIDEAIANAPMAMPPATDPSIPAGGAMPPGAAPQPTQGVTPNAGSPGPGPVPA